MKFYYILIILFFLLLTPCELNADTHLTQEYLNTHTNLLKNNGPYVISEPIIISANLEVNVEKGSEFRFAGGSIQVGGTLNLIGKENESIIINLEDSSDVAFKVYGGRIRMDFVSVLNGKGQLVEAFGSNIQISRSHFENVDGNDVFISVFSSSTLSMVDNVFKRILFTSVFQFFNGVNADIRDISVVQSGHNLVFSIFDSTDLFGKTRVNISNGIIDNFLGNGIEVSSNAYLSLEKFQISNGQGTGLYLHSSGNVLGRELEVKSNNVGLESYGSSLSITQSSFEGNAKQGAVTHGGETSLLNNWWNDTKGPYHEILNPDGGNQGIVGDTIFAPWLLERPDNKVCCSSVLFIPGIQGSRLYVKGLIENQLWEPNKNGDVKKLYLNKDGSSINKNIYTRDIIGKTNITGNFFGMDVYQGFTSYLDSLRSTGVIAGWKSSPYDWRFATDEVSKQKIQMANGTSTALVSLIESLSKESKTGKVALVAHSNGGLVAKNLLKNLIDSGKSNLIDLLVLVAVPEFGTPQSIVDILYGDSQSILGGLILSKDTAKNFAVNMPGAYGLLPSEKYFSAVNLPAIKFLNDSVRGSITSRQSLEAFLNKEFTSVNKKLLNSSNAMHKSVDEFSFKNIPVTSIVGIGNPTISGISFDDFKNDKNKRSRITSSDGDGVVLAGKSEMRTGDVYQVDLKKLSLEAKKNYQHSNILNSETVQKMISNILKNDFHVLPLFVSKSATSTIDQRRYEFSLHSPVTMIAYDEVGNRTGIFKEPTEEDLGLIFEEIPGSQYVNFGEAKTIITSSLPERIEFRGTDNGTFTFIASEFNGDQIDKEVIYKDVPVTDAMEAEFKPITSDILNIDYNADNVFDYKISPTNQSEEIDLIKEIESTKKIIKAKLKSQVLINKYVGELGKIAELVSKNKLDKAVKELKKNTEGFSKAMKLYNLIQKKLKIKKFVEPIVQDTTVLFFEFQRLSALAEPR